MRNGKYLLIMMQALVQQPPLWYGHCNNLNNQSLSVIIVAHRFFAFGVLVFSCRHISACQSVSAGELNTVDCTGSTVTRVSMQLVCSIEPTLGVFWNLKNNGAGQLTVVSHIDQGQPRQFFCLSSNPEWKGLEDFLQEVNSFLSQFIQE